MSLSQRPLFFSILGHPGMGPMQRMSHPGSRMSGPMNPVSPINPAVSSTSSGFNLLLVPCEVNQTVSSIVFVCSGYKPDTFCVCKFLLPFYLLHYF